MTISVAVVVAKAAEVIIGPGGDEGLRCFVVLRGMGMREGSWVESGSEMGWLRPHAVLSSPLLYIYIYKHA